MHIDDLFSSAGNLLASAHEHIDDVGQSLRRAFEDHTPRIIVEKDADGGQIHWIKYEVPLHPRIAVRVFNAATEIRSALDHAVYGASRALGEIHPPKRTAFVFGDDSDEMEREIKRRCQHVPANVITMMRDLKPYHGGNDTLWRLNKLRNVKDHRTLLVPDGLVDFRHLRLQAWVEPGWNGPQPDKITYRPDVPARDDQFALLRLPPGLQAKYDVNHSINVVFSEPPELLGRNVMDVLVEAKDAALAAVAAFRNGCIEVILAERAASLNIDPQSGHTNLDT